MINVELHTLDKMASAVIGDCQVPYGALFDMRVSFGGCTATRVDKYTSPCV